MPSVGGARKTFFFMVSEQVNLNHKRHPYGKIEKSTKSLYPNGEARKEVDEVMFILLGRK